jgi:hypothetical protein
MNIYNLQRSANLWLRESSIASWKLEEASSSYGIFMSKYLIFTVKILSLEPHEGVPLELAQFIAFPRGAALNKGECAKGLLL